MTHLPTAAMEKILKRGGSARVGEGAKQALKEILEEYAEKIAQRAIRFAKHARRKTIKASDIALAEKENTKT